MGFCTRDLTFYEIDFFKFRKWLNKDPPCQLKKIKKRIKRNKNNGKENKQTNNQTNYLLFISLDVRNHILQTFTIHITALLADIRALPLSLVARTTSI